MVPAAPPPAWLVPAGQVAAPVVCPGCPHCATLPSAQSAYAVVTGAPGGWPILVRDWAARGALAWVGLAAYDAATGRRDPHRVGRALAVATAIEAFVLGWTWLKAPRAPGRPAPA